MYLIELLTLGNGRIYIEENQIPSVFSVVNMSIKRKTCIILQRKYSIKDKKRRM